MGLGHAIFACLAIFLIVGVMVFQARSAARAWRKSIAGGDRGALMQLLDATFEDWRRARPARGMPPADWRALHTASPVAADHRHIRVSLLAEPDVQVVEGQRVEVQSAQEVARRAAVRMVERLLYETPYVSFQAVQVDVLTEFRDPDGTVTTRCLLTTRTGRDVASYADWDHGTAEEILGEWATREAEGGRWPDPEIDALITVEDVAAEAEAHEALRSARHTDGTKDGR
jgi:hypothetical protein